MMNKSGLGLPGDSHRFAGWLMMNKTGLFGDSHRFAGWLMMSMTMAYLWVAIDLLAG
jgi:hypothetical protein